jgi:hypothetical protein
VRVDRVVIAPAVSPARDVAGVGEFDDDPVRGPFGDADALADVAQANARITSDADQYLGVVGQKRPTRSRALRHRREHSISRLCFHAIIIMYPREGFSDPLPSHREVLDGL